MMYRTPVLLMAIVISLSLFFYVILIQETKKDYSTPTRWWPMQYIESKIDSNISDTEIDLNTIDMSSLEQNNSRLILEIRRRFLIPPPPRGTPYFLKSPQQEDPSSGQSKKVLEILKNMTGGFFIECGALDGEFMSNTLYMERKLGWTGLLVEADPNFLEMIYKIQRHAWIAPVCLSTKTSPMFVPFNPENVPGHGHLSANAPVNFGLYVPCIPIYSLLLAMNQTKVDYFSLDVEGVEMDILRTIPFDLLDIRVLTIEYNPAVKNDLTQFMIKNGYELYLDFKGINIGAQDLIFVKKTT